MLTALGTTRDKLSGFDSGADDYLVKPFEFTELMARIRALLKRTSSGKEKSNTLNFMDLEMNLDTITVTRSGKKIDLTQKEFSLLEHLLRNKEKVISRSEIAEKVWDIKFNTGTNVIDVYINFLRKKIDRDFRPRLIHTLPGFGYVLKTDGDES
jgi:DNA-binding response OmpR family regulator